MLFIKYNGETYFIDSDAFSEEQNVYVDGEEIGPVYGVMTEEDALEEIKKLEYVKHDETPEGIFAMEESKKLNEGQWRYHEELGSTLRKYIEEENYSDILKTINKIAKKWARKLHDYNFEELEQITDGEWELTYDEIEEFGYDSIVELVDERLSELYDLCDEHRIFLELFDDVDMYNESKLSERGLTRAQDFADRLSNAVKESTLVEKAAPYESAAAKVDQAISEFEQALTKATGEKQKSKIRVILRKLTFIKDYIEELDASYNLGEAYSIYNKETSDKKDYVIIPLGFSLTEEEAGMINSMIGQASDGIWEESNDRRNEALWRLIVKARAGDDEIVFEKYHGRNYRVNYYSLPEKDKILSYIANKIKLVLDIYKRDAKRNTGDPYYKDETIGYLDYPVGGSYVRPTEQEVRDFVKKLKSVQVNEASKTEVTKETINESDDIEQEETSITINDIYRVVKYRLVNGAKKENLFDDVEATAWEYADRMSSKEPREYKVGYSRERFMYHYNNALNALKREKRNQRESINESKSIEKEVFDFLIGEDDFRKLYYNTLGNYNGYKELLSETLSYAFNSDFNPYTDREYLDVSFYRAMDGRLVDLDELYALFSDAVQEKKNEGEK